jgi:hypothetical protein
LAAHALVRLGSITDAGGEPSLVPALYLCGRVDIEADGGTRKGRLHLGFALLGETNLFTGERLTTTTSTS